MLAYHQPNRLEAGCDEAGRGCLAGPVYAAAVILRPDFQHPALNDSKQLTEKQRDALRIVVEQEARGPEEQGSDEAEERGVEVHTAHPHLPAPRAGARLGGGVSLSPGALPTSP